MDNKIMIAKRQLKEMSEKIASMKTKATALEEYVVKSQNVIAALEAENARLQSELAECHIQLNIPKYID